MNAYTEVLRTTSLNEAERAELAIREVCNDHTDIVGYGSIYAVVTAPEYADAAMSRLERIAAAGWF